MGNLDSAAARMAVARHQTGVVSMKTVEQWISNRGSMNQALGHAILCSRILDYEISMKHTIYWLLVSQLHRDEMHAAWSAMSFNERRLTMEIAF
jgi:hypothetical protein